jgi:4-amino-4-deoxy-L-arabinose transferase-like glycosyltransferase
LIKIFSSLSISDPLPANSRPFPKLLWFVLIISFILNIIGINWGLPTPTSRGWVADEITPPSVLEGMRMKFSDGWSSKYPPLHFYILSAFYLPVYSLNALKILNTSYLSINATYFIIGRLVSVFMGAFILFMVYLCGCEMTDKKSALYASLIIALTPPFLYYSKTSNTDIPYVFWFIIAIYFLMRILKYHRNSDYILFAGAVVFSICTKDQAYGLFILTPLIIVFSLYRNHKEREKNPSILKLVINKKTMLAFFTGTLLFILINNWIFNFHGFKKHIFLITGPLKGQRFFANDISGHFQMLWQTVRHLNFILTLPVFLICILGFVYALSRKRKNPILFVLLIICSSYYVFFLSAVGRNYVRHLIPIYIVLSFFGGLFISYFLHSSGRFKIIKYAPVILVFIYSALYSFSIDVMMVNDSRYYVEKWMKKNIKKDEPILYIGLTNFLPRNKGFTRVIYRHRIPITDKGIIRINPHYIIFNSELLKSKRPLLYKKMSNDGLGYTQILRYKSTPWLSLLPEDKMSGHEKRKIITNLNLINPEIVIMKKKD